MDSTLISVYVSLWDYDIEQEYDFHSRTLALHYHVPGNISRLILKDKQYELNQLSTCAPELPKAAQMYASPCFDLLHGLPAITTGKKAYPNGALPMQTNNVDLYHVAPMNLSTISLMVCNTRSAFTVTAVDTPKDFFE